MADNVTLNLGSGGATIATDDDGTAQHQYVKVEFGGDGTMTKVTSSVGLPVEVLSIAGGGVAHDAADSGNPVKIGVKAETSPKGLTLVADGDRTDLFADADGLLMTKPYTSYADVINERIADTSGTSTAFTNFSQVASTRNYMTSVTIYNSSTTDGYVDIRDGAAGSVLATIPAPAKGGAHCVFPVPLRGSANTAMAYDVSAAITTVYITACGFQSKV